MAPAKRATKKRERPASVEAYLAALPPKSRAALERLRRAIRAAAPKATELISYGIPAFKQERMLVGFAAFEEHSSFFLMSTQVMRTHAKALEGYDVGKGSIRFPVAKPLPDALVKTLVRARLAENEKSSSAARRKK